MKRFSSINEKQEVSLYHIKTRKYGDELSISRLNNMILDYINELYQPFGFKYGENEDILVDGMIINGEYISKMVNNYTIFKKVIEENKIKTEDGFYMFMFNNLEEIYHYNSDFFTENTLPILINTTRKGNVWEKRSREIIEEYAKNKGFDITLRTPTLKEDISGIDLKFMLGGKIYTIQVKPYDKVIDKGDYTWFRSGGSLSINTDYLILYNEDKETFVFSKNITKNPIMINADYFVIPKAKILINEYKN